MIQRLLKILILGFCTLLLVLAGIVYFVDPNQYKDTIAKTVSNQTGQTVKIEGAIIWRWMPLLSLEVDQVTVMNAAPFEGALFSAKIARIEWAFWSIFSGKILFNLNFQDLQLALIKNADGKTNWENLSNRFLNTNPKANPKIDVPQTKIPAIMLSNVKINNSLISFEDKQTQQYYVLKELNLSADHLLEGLAGTFNPIALSFKAANQQTELLEVALSCNWSLKQNPGEITLKNIQVQFELPPPLSNTIIVKGKAIIENFAAPIIDGQLEFEKINLKPWLKTYAGVKDVMLPSFLEIKSAFHYEASVLKLYPLSINLFDSGLFEAKLGIDFHEKAPKFTLSQEGHDFELSPFLSLLGIKDKLDGKANFKINVSASGNTSDQLLKTFNGNVKLGINQGKFYGFDAVKQLKATQAKIYDLISAVTGKDIGNTVSILTEEQGKWQNDGQKKAFTAFDSLQMDATFSNGITNQSSFSILHSEYRLNGSGQLNLTNQTLQYRAALLLAHNPYPSNNEIGTALFGLPLPILITGTLTDPAIRPDLKTYFDSAFKLTQNKVIEKVIDQTVHKALDQLLKGAIGG